MFPCIIREEGDAALQVFTADLPEPRPHRTSGEGSDSEEGFFPSRGDEAVEDPHGPELEESDDTAVPEPTRKRAGEGTSSSSTVPEEPAAKRTRAAGVPPHPGRTACGQKRS